MTATKRREGFEELEDVQRDKRTKKNGPRIFNKQSSCERVETCSEIAIIYKILSFSTDEGLYCAPLASVPCNLVGGYQCNGGTYCLSAGWRTFTLKTEATFSSEALVATHEASRSHKPEEHNVGAQLCIGSPDF